MRSGSGSISRMQPAVESAVRRLPPEPPSPAVRGLRSLSCLLSCIRFGEVLVLQGSPLLGAVFSIGRLTGERVVDLAIFAAGSFCLSAHVFAAGHLTHEARDCDADLLNGIRTNAVTFGKAGSFAAGLGLFTIADALLVVLAARGTVPRALVLVAALYAMHLYWSLRTLRA